MLSVSPGIPPFAAPAVRERGRALSLSAILVAKVLTDEGPLTQAAIVAASLLAERTVGHALALLDTAALVESRYAIPDACTQVYDFSPSRSAR